MNIKQIYSLGIFLGCLLQFKVLASLQFLHDLELARRTLHFQDNFLCDFGLAAENGLGLTAISLLLPVVPPPSLAGHPILALLGERDFVWCVFVALWAVCFAGLWLLNSNNSKFLQ